MSISTHTQIIIFYKKRKEEEEKEKKKKGKMVKNKPKSKPVY